MYGNYLIGRVEDSLALSMRQQFPIMYIRLVGSYAYIIVPLSSLVRRHIALHENGQIDTSHAFRREHRFHGLQLD